eukprot:3695914-Ditylum_brightwellii.AAC.1
MEKTASNPLNILLLYNSKIEESIKELEESVIALTRRVKKLEEMKEAKNDNMFVVGEKVQYSSKPACETFDK